MFARLWCKEEFEKNELSTVLSQCSISFNPAEGTLRGMHYQVAPNEEIKIVRCTRGSIFDVALDLRPESPTFKQWFGTVLSAENHRMLYIPEGLAHGLITLEPDSEVLYHISPSFVSEAAKGVRWNDEAFKIEWPMKPAIISERDANYPDFAEAKVLKI
jgi:dTDP-4-dehydrorhamnose 3,5-epimerase